MDGGVLYESMFHVKHLTNIESLASGSGDRLAVSYAETFPRDEESRIRLKSRGKRHSD